MLTDSIPASSARVTAARSTRSLVSGIRGGAFVFRATLTDLPRSAMRVSDFLLTECTAYTYPPAIGVQRTPRIDPAFHQSTRQRSPMELSTELLREEPILSARGVAKTYRTGTHEVPALRGVDLDVRTGELLMIMGPSGNGKTTLLNCLSGLDDIDAGTVTVDGEDLFAMSDAKRTRHRANRMGFIFQSFNL